MKATKICKTAAKLVGGERHHLHGDTRKCHENIAKFWTAYTGIFLDEHDVAIMMALLKIARTKTGEVNLDDYIDGVGYLSIAGELA